MKSSHLRIVAASLSAALSSGALAQNTEESTQHEILPVVQVNGSKPSDKLSLDTPSTTGSRLGLTPRETPASVTIIERDVIEKRGATDTQEILSSVPGLTAAAPPGSAGSASYRGFGVSQLTQLFNGITVQYDAISARPVDSWIYDRVEVIGGPSTFLFGAGAVGGSINYLTKLAHRDGNEVQVKASYGSYDTSMLGLGVNGRLGADDAVRHFARADVSRTDSTGWVDGNKREAWNLAASLLTDVNVRLSHTLAVEYQNERVDRPYWGTPALQPASGELRIDEGIRFKNYNTSDGLYEQTVQWARSVLDYKLGDAGSLRNTFYHYDALRDYRNVESYRYNASNTAITRSSALLQRHDQQLNGDRVEYTRKGSLAGLPSDWAAGFDYSVNKQTRFPRSLSATVSTVDPYDYTTEHFFEIPGMVPGFVPDRSHRVTTLALFLENRTRLTDTLALVSGLRRDQIDLEVRNQRTVSATDPAYFERTYRPITGRLGVVADVAPGANVYAQYSTAADPPAGILTTATFSQVRDFDLTTGHQFEVGSKFDFAEGKGTGTIAAFTITRKNIAISDPNNPTVTIPVGQQSSRGVELAASWRAAPAWLLQGNFAYVDAQYDDFTETVSGTAVSRAGNTPSNTPARVANAWLTYTIDAQWETGVDARYVSSRYANTANTLWVPAYTIYGAYLGYHPTPNANLTLRVRNLTDEVYARWVTGTPMFYLGAPRTVELALQMRF